MEQEQKVEEQPQATATSEPEPSKMSVHFYMPVEQHERAMKFARYAALEGLIEGHPRGNFTDYCNFCFNLGEQYIRQYMLKKRGYK